jgi:sugar phosphate isomerase/epimerase
MPRFRIGVIPESFRLPPRDGIRKAKELGAEGVQIWATSGEISPEGLDAAGRGELKAFCEDLGLAISALCGDLGGHGFQDPTENPAKIEKSKAIVDLAVDLGTRVVTTHIGVVPGEKTDPTYAVMRDACRELGAYAGERDVTFAIETGPETAAVLRGFLEDVDRSGLGVNLDPANLVMVTGEDPAAATRTLGPWIVHTHAKDGVQHRACEPSKVYAGFAEGGVDGLPMGEIFQELPLGEGDVPWAEYLAALEAIGYDGFLTIEREVGDDPERDIAAAVRFLRQTLDAAG